jgi:hypothetical protein
MSCQMVIINDSLREATGFVPSLSSQDSECRSRRPLRACLRGGSAAEDTIPLSITNHFRCIQVSRRLPGFGGWELTPEQLCIHVRRNTAVARWVERTLGWRPLLRACVGQ